MTKELETAVQKLVKNWDKVRASYITKKEEYGSGRESKIGSLWWDNPNVIFVLVTGNEEEYEGSQTQIGVTKDGKLKWEYQSHCSCNDYEDSDGIGEDFPPADMTKKIYELNDVPLDWQEKIIENITKLLSK